MLVKCDWCGEVYKESLFCCPKCQQQEHSPISQNTENEVKCDWCGEVYKGSLFCCPKCQQQENSPTS